MLYDQISEVFELVVKYCILIIEFIGVAVLLFTVVRSIVMLVRHRNYVRLQLAEGIALALEFKMGGEVLIHALHFSDIPLGIVLVPVQVPRRKMQLVRRGIDERIADLPSDDAHFDPLRGA